MLNDVPDVAIFTRALQEPKTHAIRDKFKVASRRYSTTKKRGGPRATKLGPEAVLVAIEDRPDLTLEEMKTTTISQESRDVPYLSHLFSRCWILRDSNIKPAFVSTASPQQYFAIASRR